MVCAVVQKAARVGLLFDDWGIEYGQSSGKGDSFVKAKIRGVINYR